MRVKMLLTIAGVVLGLILIAGFVRGWQSQQAPLLGLTDGALLPCPDRPNCVSSESGEDTVHSVKPLDAALWPDLPQAIEAAGGVMLSSDEHYLHAGFTSSLFRFVDDVEARLDEAAGVIHIRSASRVGHSDFGVNRKRVEALRSTSPAAL